MVRGQTVRPAEFYRALGISRATYFTYLRLGWLPAPVRIYEGSRWIRYSKTYLCDCRRALRARRTLVAVEATP